MNKKVLIGILAGLGVLAVFIIVMILGRNGSQAPTTPTTNPELILTAANQTAEAMVTQIFATTPSATPVTPTPTVDVVQTIAAQTAIALQTQAASLTPTLGQTSATTPIPPGPSSGDLALYVADVTIPDGTVIQPGAAFKKTWKLQNAGSSTWTTSYSFAYVSGEKMGSVTSVPLTQSVAPGTQIEISVDMVAPTTAGKYQSYWKMKNASGQFFNESVYVLINVGSSGTSPTATSGTPASTVSPTSTGIPTNPITSLTMSVDNPTFSGTCPHTFIFTAALKLNQSATLTYKLEAGSETPGFVFVLPGPQTHTFDAGTYSIPSELTFTSNGTGWVRMHVTSPVDTTSNQATFDLTCTP
jgi:hypothetical protein